MHYDSLYAEIETADRQAYEDEFGHVYRQQHPYQPNGERIHRKVLALLEQERNERF